METFSTQIPVDMYNVKLQKCYFSISNVFWTIAFTFALVYYDLLLKSELTYCCVTENKIAIGECELTAKYSFYSYSHAH